MRRIFWDREYRMWATVIWLYRLMTLVIFAGIAVFGWTLIQAILTHSWVFAAAATILFMVFWRPATALVRL